MTRRMGISEEAEMEVLIITIIWRFGTPKTAIFSSD